MAVGIVSDLMDIAKGLQPEDELVTQKDWEETLNCDRVSQSKVIGELCGRQLK